MIETTERSALIARYRAGYAAVMAAIADITDAELDFRAAEGEWTAREIVHHLADSELRSTLRLRQLVAEDAPVIQGYDEEAYARRLHYDRPIAPSLQALEAARASNSDFFDYMTAEDWQRTGTHSESGPYTLSTWLAIYTAHPHDHAAQIAQMRAAYRTSSKG